MNNVTIISKDRAIVESKQSHINALIRIKQLPKHTQQKFSTLEMYHMAALHRRWFSSSRKENEV